MGVAASMSVSILRRGKLWGLFASVAKKPYSVASLQAVIAALARH